MDSALITTANNNNNALKVVTINVNSMRTAARKLEFMRLLENSDPDVVLVSETKLEKKDKWTLADYTIHRADRKRGGGGTAVVCKQNLNAQEIKQMTKSKPKTLEIAAVKLMLEDNSTLVVCSTYAPPENTNSITSDLEMLIDGLRRRKELEKFLLMGDLNGRHKAWGDNCSNRRGNIMQGWSGQLADSELRLITAAKPTFPRSGAFLDVAIASNSIKILNLERGKLETLACTSDHRAVLALVDIESIGSRFKKETIETPVLLFGKNNWATFKKRIERNFTVEIDPYANMDAETTTKKLTEVEKYLNDCMEK